MHLEILDPPRLRLISQLGFINSYQFYLAGGTALALQIGHRTSVDFDFYTPQLFEPLRLFSHLQKEIPSAENHRMAEGTLIAMVEGDIELSFFQYDYPLIDPLASCPPLQLASLKDIAAMKVVAISQRGIRRDFVDLYFLAEEIGLFEIIVASMQKYKGLDVYNIFQSLCYFEDAEKGSERSFQALKPVNWNEVKGFFLKEVKRVQKLF